MFSLDGIARRFMIVADFMIVEQADSLNHRRVSPEKSRFLNHFSKKSWSVGGFLWKTINLSGFHLPIANSNVPRPITYCSHHLNDVLNSYMVPEMFSFQSMTMWWQPVKRNGCMHCMLLKPLIGTFQSTLSTRNFKDSAKLSTVMVRKKTSTWILYMFLIGSRAHDSPHLFSHRSNA